MGLALCAPAHSHRRSAVHAFAPMALPASHRGAAVIRSLQKAQQLQGAFAASGAEPDGAGRP